MGDSEPKLGRFEARISCARHFVSKAYEKGSVRCKINTTNQVCSLNVTEDFRSREFNDPFPSATEPQKTPKNSARTRAKALDNCGASFCTFSQWC